METNKLNQAIKIHCPTHGSIFEMDSTPQINCDTVEHSLSNGFPISEYWEYCCDCQTFTPSTFGAGGKAKSSCFNCNRKSVNFFLCDECKIVSYDSNENTKGKIYKLDAKDGMLPDCVGCQKSFLGIKIYQHKCEDIDGSYLSCRNECPFCLKLIRIQSPSTKTSNKESDNTQTKNQSEQNQCPNCNSTNPITAPFCGNCGQQLLSNISDIKFGTSQAKTKLLGSICPNCGGVSNKGIPFCGNCGQALKTNSEMTTPSNTFTVPNPSVSIIPDNLIDNTIQTDRTVEKKNNSNIVYGGIIAGIVFLGIAFITAISINNTTEISGSNTNVNDSIAPDSNVGLVNNPKAPSPTIKPTTTEELSPFIGRKGRLTTNVNVRTASNKFSQVIGTHYENAKIEVLDAESYYSDDREYVTWYKVKILEDGYDSKTGNGRGNNWEREGNFGWMEAKKLGWMNSKFILLE